MTFRNHWPVLMAVGLVIAACNSGPSRSASTSAATEAAVTEGKIEHIEGLLARRGQAGHALEALTAALPERVWLTEITYDSGKVRAKGRAATNNLLADYITRLGESPSFTNMTLGGSVMRTVQGRETQEFTFDIALLNAGIEEAPEGTAPAERLRALEAMLPARQDMAEMLREVQGLARDAGLQMTAFAPGAGVAGEFTEALPVAIDVAGSFASLGRYLDGLAGLSRLWVVEKFFMKAAAPDDPRSQVRAAVSAKTYLAR
jgi:hypothetical protein